MDSRSGKKNKNIILCHLRIFATLAGFYSFFMVLLTKMKFKTSNNCTDIEIRVDKLWII